MAALPEDPEGISTKVNIRSFENVWVFANGAGLSFWRDLWLFGRERLIDSPVSRCYGAARVGDSPDLMMFSFSRTVHFHEPGSTPCTTVKLLPRYSIWN